ncbi:MAG: LytTR family transcriptional regulator [Clostridia bacterium]|nr:LytTR family transcriptional regulator [Clostridia bacterium]MBQ7788159.1 LytTR family transcriptional regulator [Clostridia bacterium]
MKCTTIIDNAKDEEVIIYAHEVNNLVKEIELLIESNLLEFVGYKNNTIIKLMPSDIYSFTVENNKIFAITANESFQIKRRLYEIEQMLDNNFVKINQSCIVNIKKIEKFEVSFGGALLVLLKNGYKDYVSRRQLKIVKERIGF